MPNDFLYFLLRRVCDPSRDADDVGTEDEGLHSQSRCFSSQKDSLHVYAMQFGPRWETLSYRANRAKDKRIPIWSVRLSTNRRAKVSRYRRLIYIVHRPRWEVLALERVGGKTNAMRNAFPLAVSKIYGSPEESFSVPHLVHLFGFPRRVHVGYVEIH